MIQIALHQTDARFRPSDVITGDVTWSEMGENVPVKLEIRLIWYTSGKGDRDHDVVDSRSIENPDEKGSIRFEFIAPHRPFSFSGRLISLTWALEAIAFPQKDAERCELIISSSGSEVVLTPIKEEDE